MTTHSFNKAMGPARKQSKNTEKLRKSSGFLHQPAWDRIGQRKCIKKRLLTTKFLRLNGKLSRQYLQKYKEVIKSARAEKPTYIENLEEETEAAARRKDTRFQITKKLKGDTGPNQNLPLKDAMERSSQSRKRRSRDGWSISSRFSIAHPHPLADIPKDADDHETNLDQITEAYVRKKH